MFPDLRRHCAVELLRLDADGYAIGGLSVGEPRVLSLRNDRNRRAYAVSGPAEKCHDGLRPASQRSQGVLFTSTGRVVIKQVQYKEDTGPVDVSCSCYACWNTSLDGPRSKLQKMRPPVNR